MAAFFTRPTAPTADRFSARMRIAILAALGAALLLPSPQASASDKQKAIIKIDQGSVALTVKNVNQRFGIWHKENDADAELKNDAIEGMACPADQVTTICARGKKNLAEGTEGYFELWDGKTKVGTFYFDSPYGLGDNKADFVKDGAAAKKYSVEVIRDNKTDSGALGTVTITVSKR